MKPGKVIDIETKEVIGEHQGVYYYTIGQRKGFAIGGNRGPYFCVGKDVYKNELYLATKDDHKWLYSTSCLVTGVNFMVRPDVDSFDCNAKFRYRQADNAVHVDIIDATTVMVNFKEPLKAVTVGQQAVLYLDDVCLGGGVIDKVYQDGVDKDDILKEYLNA